MNPPKCKLCGSPHWTYDEHKITGQEALQRVGAAVLRKPEEVAVEVALNVYAPAIEELGRTEKRTEMNKRTNKRTRGRPRKWASEAERLRAYRERSITK